MVTKMAREFVVLLAKSLQFGGRENFPINKQFEPVGGFFKFPQRITDLRDEFRLVASAIGFPVIRTD